MSKYRVQVSGRNVLLEVDGRSERLGFYTHVFVEALTELEAKAKGLRLIAADQKLKAGALNHDGDPMRLSVVEVEVLDSFEGRNMPRTGLIFFPDERGF